MCKDDELNEGSEKKNHTMLDQIHDQAEYLGQELDRITADLSQKLDCIGAKLEQSISRIEQEQAKYSNTGDRRGTFGQIGGRVDHSSEQLSSMSRRLDDLYEPLPPIVRQEQPRARVVIKSSADGTVWSVTGSRYD